MVEPNLGLALDRQKGCVRLVELPAPVAGAGEIVVDVDVSAINEIDVEIRAGKWRRQAAAFQKRGPVLTGFEFAGVVRSRGRRLLEGQRVFGYVHVMKGARTHARTVAVPEDAVHEIPDTMSMQEAAALPSMGLSAIDVFENLKPLEKEARVLVIGAAGGLGTYAVQLAVSQGAKVVAVCSERNEAWVRGLGADEVRPYEHGAALRDGDRFDLVLDGPSKYSFAKCRRYLAPDGMYVTTNPFDDLWGFVRAFASRRRAGFMLVLDTNPSKLRRLLDLVEEGAIRPAIDSCFPIDRSDEAFDHFGRRGKQGRVLLDFAASTRENGS